MSRFRVLALLPLMAFLSGCNFTVLHPAGDVAWQQRDLVIISTVLMLIIIIPVMALTVLFAWRYRQSNTEARYEPEWHHSTHLELVIWAAPLLIIICLGALTWMGTHLLDPYRPIERISENQPVPANAQPLEVEVVALDWKWLFIYPQYGIATVNELAAPVDRPISFRITASSVMNSFYIPALAGQIYAMPGMQTKLHAVINEAGSYRGFSANYSGAGFSGMHFRFLGQSPADFDAWLASAKAGGGDLTRAAYLELEKPSQNVPVTRFAQVDPALYNAILNMCVEPGKMCMSEMMAIDAKGGLGMAGINNVLPLTYDKFARRGTVFGGSPAMVVGICAPEDLVTPAASVGAFAPRQLAPREGASAARILGAGLPAPSFTPISAPADLLAPAARRPSNS
ncbi:MAG: ubiquinol oxidase subunit II [Rhizobiales bacterium 24-66-13]|nr:MAG: ubiquinol oxidase subunit II [Rhizobiales bacterium 24-66-13]OZB07901.1 MAG: ubiquinol oxidase subunit II [Rhizobiales bacterium 39-66-18]HQS10531.1 ubiquinol oxidase subunit II [Xanthobacteraceae bacterium]HQS45102.1 ubiquinol oxidase subunit II [Xanthobacteraceae bacterium]